MPQSTRSRFRLDSSILPRIVFSRRDSQKPSRETASAPDAQDPSPGLHVGGGTRRRGLLLLADAACSVTVHAEPRSIPRLEPNGIGGFRGRASGSRNGGREPCRLAALAR